MCERACSAYWRDWLSHDDGYPSLGAVERSDFECECECFFVRDDLWCRLGEASFAGFLVWIGFTTGPGWVGATSAGAGAATVGAGAATVGAGAATVGAGAATVGAGAGFAAGSVTLRAAAVGAAGGAATVVEDVDVDDAGADWPTQGSFGHECQSEPPAASKPAATTTSATPPPRRTLRLASGAKSSASSTLPPQRLISTGRVGRGGVGGFCKRAGDTDKI
jgi:hypothetical protein